MSDGEQAEEPMRRSRGRHAVPKRAAVARDGWRARLGAVAAAVVASAEPRISAAGAWLFERRLHVLVITATVATVAMIGGAVALISVAGAPRPAGEAATVIESPRPTSTDRDSPSTYAPILPSPGPPPSASPNPTPSPDDASGDPATEATDGPDAPTTEPTPTDEPRRDTAPGATNRPEKPKD